MAYEIYALLVIPDPQPLDINDWDTLIKHSVTVIKQQQCSLGSEASLSVKL